jgi:hypothetical protein
MMEKLCSETMIKQNQINYLNSQKLAGQPYPTLGGKRNCRGAILIVVLGVIMAITVISLGFLASSDVELSSGCSLRNWVNLQSAAASSIEHARGMISINAHKSVSHWTGISAYPAGNDFEYDITVSKDSPCNYSIDSFTYKSDAAEKSLTAKLRIDPCIALWLNKGNISPDVWINGDVFCDDNTTIYGNIDGDVFSTGDITKYGSITGRRKAQQTSYPVEPPQLTYADFPNRYYYNGSGPYNVTLLTKDIYDGVLDVLPTAPADNPAGIYVRNGNLKIDYSVTINGTLVVKDDLELNNSATVTVISRNKMPGLVVGHDLRFNSSNTTLNCLGLCLINHHIDLKNNIYTSLYVNGAVVILGDGILNVPSLNSTVGIVGDPDYAAIEIHPEARDTIIWTPAGGSFFKYIN